jgi:hypothetical protein
MLKSRKARESAQEEKRVPGSEPEDWRTSERIRLNHPIILRMGKARVKATLQEISEGGLRFITSICRDIGERYVAEITCERETVRFLIETKWDYYVDGWFISGAEIIFRDEIERLLWKEFMELLRRKQVEEDEESLNARIERRISKPLPILFRDRVAWVKGTLVNISHGGALIHVKVRNHPEKSVEFKTKVEDRQYTFRAQLIWDKFIDGEYHLGVKFITPADEHQGPAPAGSPQQA